MSRRLPSWLEGLANASRDHGPYKISERALELHRRLTVIDLHADPLMWSRDLLVRNHYGHVDIPRLIEGGVALQVFSTVTHSPLGINIRRNRTDAPDMIKALAMVAGWPRAAWDGKLERALFQARALAFAVKNSGGRMAQVLSQGDLRTLAAKPRPGATAAMLSIEGGQCFEGRLESIDTLFDAGVRMVGLTHFVDNDLGCSASGEVKGGLTDFGRAALKRMEDKRIVIDLAHASPKLFDEVLDACTRPPVVSHTGACSACPNERNLTDDQLKKIAAKDGVVGVGYWKTATGGDDAAAIARSIQVVMKVAGARTAALGSDFDGAVAAPFDASGIPLVTQALLEADMGEDDIASVMGANVLRLLSEGLPAN